MSVGGSGEPIGAKTSSGIAMTEKGRSDLATFALIGMFSGAAARALVMFIDEGSYTSTLTGTRAEVGTFSILPGVVFGSVIGFLWHRRGMASKSQLLGYAFASGVAYFISFQVAINVFDWLPGMLGEVVALVVSGISAGLVGCVLLGIATAYLLRVPYESALGVPVVVGGIAGGLLPLINVLNDWGFMLFLGLWQGAYAASLAGLLRPATATLASAMRVGKERA